MEKKKASLPEPPRLPTLADPPKPE